MIYVIVQFSCIVYLIINTQVENLNPFSIALIIFSIVLGLLALFNIRPSNLNILPQLKDKHQLITSGVYRYIRHPMYTSVILFCLALLITNVDQFSIVVMLILVIDLILKSNVEEMLLSKRFNSYLNYQKKTGKFLPFL